MTWKAFRTLLIDSLIWSISVAACVGMAAWAWNNHMEALSEYQPLVNGQVFEVEGD